MTEPIRYESLVPPRNDEERDLMDPEAWDWSSAERGEPVPDVGAVLEVHFTGDEFLALARLARQEGIGPGELLRQLALERITVGRAGQRAI